METKLICLKVHPYVSSPYILLKCLGKLEKERELFTLKITTNLLLDQILELYCFATVQYKQTVQLVKRNPPSFYNNFSRYNSLMLSKVFSTLIFLIQKIPYLNRTFKYSYLSLNSLILLLASSCQLLNPIVDTQ